MSNVVDLSFYRKKRDEELEKINKDYPPALTFEVGQYYIMPELGVMIHVVHLTDKLHTQDGHPTFIMEDQFGNIFSEKMEEGMTTDWHSLTPDVFVETAKLLRKDNEPEPPKAV